MNNNFFIFLSLFILLLMLCIIILLYYIYKSYSIYKFNVDNNFLISENNINETSIAFEKLQEDIDKKLDILNKKNNDIILKEPLRYNTLNSNLNKIFNINNFNDFINSNLSNDININMNSKIINYSGITNLTDNNNYFKICNNSINETNRKCINLNVDNSGNFNIYPGLNSSSNTNISSLSIFNNNKNILAKFDLTSNIISLGSENNPAISINNNIYTPNIIICNFTFNMATSSQMAKINLNYISNYNLQKGSYLNFIINTTYNFYLAKNQTLNNYIDISKITYSNNILKLFISNQIPANNITILSLNIMANDSNYPIYNQVTPTTTNGYLTLS